MRSILFRTVVVLALFLPATGYAQRSGAEPDNIQGGDPAPSVSMEILSPSSQFSLPLLSESGWPLVVEIGVLFPSNSVFPGYAVQPNFPVKGDWGFLIFNDPDGCLNPPAPSWMAPQTPECGVPDPLPPDWDPSAWTPPPSDEDYLEFWPDEDIVGVEDNAGNEDQQMTLLDSGGSNGPEFDKWVDGSVLDCTPDSNDSDCSQFGPPTGGEIIDGYGFGADDDLTGLIVISQFGVGNTYNEPDFVQTNPVGAVNLAGLANAVNYELSSLLGGPPPMSQRIQEKSRIWSEISFPKDVIRHIIQYDACVGEVTYSDPPANTNPESCADDDLWRIDGGPVQTPPMNYGRPDAASIDLLEATTFEIRVLIVEGEAPDVLFDANGDGVVGYLDAIAAGYTVISKEDIVVFEQLSELLCWGGGGNAVPFDLDGNGVATVPIVCGPGPGNLGRPPR